MLDTGTGAIRHMKSRSWKQECKDLVEQLKSKEPGSECSIIVNTYEKLFQAIWELDARLLGNLGAAAVFSRAIQKTVTKCPELKHIRVSPSGLDFQPFNEYVSSAGCTIQDVDHSLLCFCSMLFDLEAELTGEVLSQARKDHFNPSL